LKTHRRLVHLQAVGQQTVLFRAHRLQRAAYAVHPCPLSLGVGWVDGTTCVASTIVLVRERRENALDRSQHLLRVNDTFVGCSRSLDGSVDDPHHGQDRDDGQYSRSAKCV
jgi:hypothetical protein